MVNNFILIISEFIVEHVLSDICTSWQNDINWDRIHVVILQEWYYSCMQPEGVTQSRLHCNLYSST